MSLIISGEYSAFDTDSIRKGYVAYVKHVSWDEGKAGVITSVRKDRLVLQYYPYIENVTNHAFIDVDEVVDGQWTIRWSKDLTDVYEYPEKPTDTTDEGDIDDNI